MIFFSIFSPEIIKLTIFSHFDAKGGLQVKVLPFNPFQPSVHKKKQQIAGEFLFKFIKNR